MPSLPKIELIVKRAVPTFQLIEITGHDYYRTLREKLGWGGGIRSDRRFVSLGGLAGFPVPS